MDSEKNDSPKKNILNKLEDINLDGVDVEVFADKLNSLYTAITEMYTYMVESSATSPEDPTYAYHVVMKLRLDRHLKDQTADHLISTYKASSLMLKQIKEEYKKKTRMVESEDKENMEGSFVFVDKNLPSTSAEVAGVAKPLEDITNKPDNLKQLEDAIKEMKSIHPHFFGVRLNGRCIAHEECCTLCTCVLPKLNQNKQKEKKKK